MVFLKDEPKLEKYIKAGVLEVGDYTYGGPSFDTIREDSDYKIKIGKFCSIAELTRIMVHVGHQNLVSNYPLIRPAYTQLFRSAPVMHEKDIMVCRGDLIIGNDVWTGRNSMIFCGLTIGDGAIIGAGAVITKDVGPYEVWVGNPARCVKKRFTEEQIEALLRIKWWDFDKEKLEEAMPLLCRCDPQPFIDQYGGQP